MSVNAYLVSDAGGEWTIVAARNRRHALALYPTPYAEHARLLERDTDYTAGDITFAYQRSRGVDLILGGVIEPSWRCKELNASYDDYRDWNGFVKATNGEWEHERKDAK